MIDSVTTCLLGLNKLRDEQKTLIEKVKFQQENTQDENTQLMNISLLSDKIKEVEDKKQPLEVQAEEVFNTLFEKQENSKIFVKEYKKD